MSVDNRREELEVLLVDEQELFRKGLRAALEEAGFIVVGDFSSEKQVQALADQISPRLIVACSLGLPHWDRLVRTLLLWQSGIVVLGITEQPTQQIIVEALVEGVTLCISRQQPVSEWVATINDAWSGHLEPEKAIGSCTSSARHALLYLSRPSVVDAAQSLVPKPTIREGQVLQALSEGIALPQVADKLVIDADTLYGTLRSVRKKVMTIRRLQLLLETLCEAAE